MSRGSARRVDADPGNVNRRFRELEARVDSLDVGKISSVPGSTVTIEQFLTEPAQLVQFNNTDTATCTGPGSVAVALSHLPIAGSEKVEWEGHTQPSTLWSRVGQVLTLFDPDDFHESGDEITVSYAHLGLGVDEPEPGSFKSVESNQVAAATPATTLNIPITSPAAGDLILLAVSRATAPAGWTLLQEVTEGATVRFRVYSRSSDGTETGVTVTGPSGYIAGISVVFNGGAVADSADELQDPRLSTTYTPPTISLGTPVCFAMYDGQGSPPDEHITAVSAGELVNMNVDNGRYGMAASLDMATFTGTAGDSNSLWMGITVGVHF